jgi:hypothetical protein
MIVAEKPPLDDNLLIHYGIKGMKWGLRRGKSVTGLTRHRGATIDRNERIAKRLTDARAGRGPIDHRMAVALGRKTLGSKRWELQYQKRMSEINAQNQRLRTGKATVTDRLEMFMLTPLSSLVVTKRPA